MSGQSTLDQRKKVIVFGAGGEADLYVRQISWCNDRKETPAEEWLRVVDNDASKWGTLFYGRLVENPAILEDVQKIQKEYYIVIGTSVYDRQIARQLEELGYAGHRDFMDCAEYMAGVCSMSFEEAKQFCETVIQRQNGETLYATNREGTILKQVMLSKFGAQIRAMEPDLRPVCGCFPDMLIALANGGVSTCCVDIMGRQTLGNLYREPLHSIWRDSACTETDLYKYKLCRTCIGNSSLAPLTSKKNEREVWTARFEKKAPSGLQLEIMAACNYRCPCPAPKMHVYRKAAKMDLERMYESIRECLPELDYINLFHFGEPLLNNQLGEFMKKCRKDAPKAEMALSTNGMLLDEKAANDLIDAKIDLVIFSAHGAPGTEGMRRFSGENADYDKLLSNVERLLRLRREKGAELPKAHLKTALLHWNDAEEQMNAFREDALKLGLNSNGGGAKDIYYWVIDSSKKYASKKFVAGSDALRRLVERGEFQGPEWY